MNLGVEPHACPPLPAKVGIRGRQSAPFPGRTDQCGQKHRESHTSPVLADDVSQAHHRSPGQARACPSLEPGPPRARCMLVFVPGGDDVPEPLSRWASRQKGGVSLLSRAGAIHIHPCSVTVPHPPLPQQFQMQLENLASDHRGVGGGIDENSRLEKAVLTPAEPIANGGIANLRIFGMRHV